MGHKVPACLPCDLCTYLFNNNTQLKTHLETEHEIDGNKVKVSADFIYSLIKKNTDLNNEVRNVKDNLERLSDIYQKEQGTVGTNTLEIEIELNKTREEYRSCISYLVSPKTFDCLNLQPTN